MQTELRGCVPKLSFSYTKTLVNRAWSTIRTRNLWSFLLFNGQWIAPPQYTGISAATTQGSASVQLSAQDISNLSTLLPTQTYSLITQRQFRITSGGLYNIVAYDLVTGILTLDRWYGEATTTGSAFQIYQCYYVPTVNNSPITDFKSWISVRDMADFRSLYTDRYTRRDLDMRDPQRSWYGIPTDVVPYGPDPVTGALMFELWGAPTFNLNYQLYGIRGGTDLAAPSATLPPVVREATVMALARVYAYEWAEANKSLAPRNVGPDFRFLMGAAKAEYETFLGEDRRADRETIDLWFTSFRLDSGLGLWPFYNTQGGTANPGGFV
jgi:hypothetical protein